jgi:hypothetical protein
MIISYLMYDDIRLLNSKYSKNVKILRNMKKITLFIKNNLTLSSVLKYNYFSYQNPQV